MLFGLESNCKSGRKVTTAYSRVYNEVTCGLTAKRTGSAVSQKVVNQVRDCWHWEFCLHTRLGTLLFHFVLKLSHKQIATSWPMNCFRMFVVYAVNMLHVLQSVKSTAHFLSQHYPSVL